LIFSLARAKGFTTESTEDTGSLEIAQAFRKFGDLVFLEEADGGDSGGSGFETGSSVG